MALSTDPGFPFIGFQKCLRLYACPWAWIQLSWDCLMSMEVFEVFCLLHYLKGVNQFLINFFNSTILPFSGCFEKIQLPFSKRDGEWRMITEMCTPEGHHSGVMNSALKLHLSSPSFSPTQSTFRCANDNLLISK